MSVVERIERGEYSLSIKNLSHLMRLDMEAACQAVREYREAEAELLRLAKLGLLRQKEIDKCIDRQGGKCRAAYCVDGEYCRLYQGLRGGTP